MGLKILFLKLSNVDVLFDDNIFIWRFYITNKTLLTIKQVRIIDKTGFVIAALDTSSKIFVMYIAIQKEEEMAMDPVRKAQIET